jgi:hypothetical protein
MRLDGTRNSEFVITAREYAVTHAITEQQVIKRISIGNLPGYQAQGVWYVRLGMVSPSPTIVIKPRWTWLQPLLFTIVVALLIITGLIGSWWILWNQPVTIESETGNLRIEVKIRDKLGKLQPVVGSNFFLISKNLETIANEYIHTLSQTEILSKNNWSQSDKTPKWVNMFASTTALRSLLFDTSSNIERINMWDFRQNFEKSKILWNDYVIQTVATNQTGIAQFESIPIQAYWVMGWTATNSGFSFWEQWIKIKQGNNELLLNPENAVYFR